MSTVESKHLDAVKMTQKQWNVLSCHTCQWCKAVIKQGRRFIDALGQGGGSLPWEEPEQDYIFLAEKTFFITAIHHAVEHLERFHFELAQRGDSSFLPVLEMIGTYGERKRIKPWRKWDHKQIKTRLLRNPDREKGLLNIL